jgi:enoyl-CoA hydratase/carnithine racemase
MDHPQSLSMLSLADDEAGLAMAPQLAAFAASSGITTRLVTAIGHESAASLWAAREIDRDAPLRPGLYVGDVPDGTTIDLSIHIIVLDRGQPSLGDATVTEATVLAVAAGTATEQELARTAIAVDNAGRCIDGILVADPDPTDRTSGRHTMDERSRRPALPTKLTGIPSSGAAAGAVARSRS